MHFKEPQNKNINNTKLDRHSHCQMFKQIKTTIHQIRER